MLLVGPRPEDPRYVDLDDPVHREVFGGVPGITGPTALAYRDEERVLTVEATLLARADGRDGPTDADVERAYREVILPHKLELDRDYLRSRSIRGDLQVLLATIAPRRSSNGSADQDAPGRR
jgi:lipopolysaccharide/colanic/teichoic acid biosynthesis glycosyltransferase